MQSGLIYHQAKTKEVALTRLARWYDRVDKSGFLSFGTITRTVQSHYLNIINFFDKRSTNAASESFNAKVKAFRSQFRGSEIRRFSCFD
jgi:transposase